MNIHYQISKDIPVVAEPDVLVIGGGPGGMSAAVMAARQGCRVMLAERGGGPGGSRTVLVCPHCNHRLVVVLAPEQEGGRNGGGPGRRPNNGR